MSTNKRKAAGVGKNTVCANCGRPLKDTETTTNPNTGNRWCDDCVRERKVYACLTP